MQFDVVHDSPPAAGVVPEWQSAALRSVRLPLAQKAPYAAGNLVELVVTSTLNVFVLFYVTAVCGLPGALAGLALGAGLVLDAITEPLIGSLTDSWRSRWGRRVPFMVAGLLPILVAFNLIFALPPTMSDTSLFLWLMFLSVILRTALSVYTLPYQALGAELSDDYAERSSIAAWRWGVGMLGTIAVIVLGYGVFLSGPGGMARRANYLPLTLSLSVIVLAGALIAIGNGLTTRDRQHEVTTPTASIRARLFGEVAEVFSNRTFRIVFIASLLFNIGTGATQALFLHVGTFFWRLDSSGLQALALAAVAGLMLGAPIASAMISKIEKRAMLLTGKVGTLVCNVVPITLQVLGMLPLQGGALVIFLATTTLISGVSVAIAIIAFLSIVADAADEHEYLFGTRREGLYFAGWSFAAKSATGAGILIAGVLLQLINFPTDLAEGGAASAILPPSTVAWLGIVSGPGAALLSVAAMVIILRYKIDRAAHARIMIDLSDRRTAMSGA